MNFKEALPYVYADCCIHIPKNGYYVKKSGDILMAHDKVDGGITFRRWYPNAGRLLLRGLGGLVLADAFHRCAGMA